MTASQEMIDFLTDLSGDKAAKQLSYRLAREKKKKLVAEIDGMLTDDERDKLANAVNISTTDARTGESIPLVSDRGQRHEVETRQIGKTTGFTNAEVLELGKTLGRVLEMARKLKKDGMSAQEIADELFTPLMRQKLIPEGQIPDEFSETAKLLRETFKAYRETLKEASQERAKARVETAVKLHGATGSKLDQVLALKDTVMQFGSDTVSKTAGRALRKMGLADTQEEQERALELGMKAIEVEKASIELGKTGGEFQSGELVESQEKLLDPTVEDSDGWGKTKIIGKGVGMGVGSALVPGIKTALGVMGAVKDAPQRHGPTPSEAYKAAAILVGAIDQALAAAVTSVVNDAGTAVLGSYEDAVDPADVVAPLMTDAPAEANPAEAIAVLAKGFVTALKDAAPEGAETAFASVAATIAGAFTARAKTAGKAVAEGFFKDPANAFEPWSKAASAAVGKGLAAVDVEAVEGEPETDGSALAKFKHELAKNDVKEALLEKKRAAMQEEWELAEEDLAEAERQLVLIDEAGEAMAEQRTLEKLIAQLQKDKQILETVVSAAGTLTALGSNGMAIAQQLSLEAAKNAPLVGGVLASAKLIAQLTVNSIKAAERWRLWYKFRNEAGKALRARNALLPAIQNFYDNKKEQIAQHTIDDAMLAIQLAGAICKTVPEPVTMAAGTLVGAVGTLGAATNTFAWAAYGEAALRNAWNATQAALADPKDRKAGLDALQVNPTLAIHAVAWAAVERKPPDPIARSVSAALGINEQTLAAGATASKFRKYLTDLLAEDRQLTDSEKGGLNWRPSKIQLTRAGFLALKHRAATKARPKLNASQNTAAIEEALKAVENQVPPERVLGLLNKISNEQLQRFQTELTLLDKALNAWQPIADPEGPHQEMAEVVAELRELVLARQIVLKKAVEAKNPGM